MTVLHVRFGAWALTLREDNEQIYFNWSSILHRFYSVEVSLSLVAHLILSDPQ
jgi:hypothetical protein